MSPIVELLTLSKRIGKKNPFWVQGAGGNTSVKMDEGGVSFLRVKASGLRLEDVLDETHFSKLSMKDVSRKLAHITGGDEDANELAYAGALTSSAINTTDGRRPSMETGFHVFLPKKYVLHFHSLPALLMAHEAARDPAKIKAWLEKNWEGGFEFVEPCMPGWTLTNRLKNSGLVSLLLLKNHGLILQSDDGLILDRWQALETQFFREWNYALTPTSSLPPAPLRIYFPDTAVFIERLRAVLSPSVASAKGGEPVYTLRPDAVKLDKDAVEIWEATALLYNACPTLEQLPENISSRVAGLPTEKFRRSLHAASGESNAH